MSWIKVASLSVLSCLLVGCAGYSTWPPVDEKFAGKNLVNYEPMPRVIGDAVSFVTLRYPAVDRPTKGQLYDEPFVLNLPSGADGEAYERIIARIGRGCQAPSESNTSLPTYHVTRAIIRNVTAEVDVVRPVLGLGDTVRYQGVTVYLNGGLNGWTVANHRAYPLGLFDVPARNIPAPVIPVISAP